MTETSTSPMPDALVRLARACGVSTDYIAWNGDARQCSEAAVRAALRAMDLDSEDDAACERSLAALEDFAWAQTVPPVTVVRRGTSHDIPVHVKHGNDVVVTLQLEGGGERTLTQVDRFVEPRGTGSQAVGRATFTIPPDIPLGWHKVQAVSPGRKGRGYVVVTPERVTVPSAVMQRRPWGIATQLYSVRSSRSWGLGDLGDLAELCSLAKLHTGADFVLVNPLHACEPVSPIEPSPYLPVSRRFLSPLYIRVEDIPEVAYVPSQDRAVIEWVAERPKRANATDDLLDRDVAWEAKSQALTHVYQVPRSPGREAQFQAYCIREGRVLEEFATWCAMREEYDGVEWPTELTNPSSAAVSAWREDHADRVLYYAWLQWIADEQLQAAQATAERAGMSIGVMTDLAVGVHPHGADAWAWRRVLARHMSVGAPPDMYNQQGQDWSQPPWQPRALAAAAYLPFREVVRAAVRHAGAVRIDHILGMFRQWWIPKGHGASDGVYVTCDHEALIGIIALEAERAGAMVIGEDLGTVQPWVTDYLNARGILGTSILWFEADDSGPKPPEHYRADVMVAVTTHDLPPTAAYLAGDHVTLREQLGLLVEDPETMRERASQEIERMLAFVDERGWLHVDPNEEDMVAAIHALAFATPSLLKVVALTDMVGERKTQNQPGTHKEYPNWRVPLCDGNGVPVLLDDLFEHPRLTRFIAAVEPLSH